MSNETDYPFKVLELYLKKLDHFVNKNYFLFSNERNYPFWMLELYLKKFDRFVKNNNFYFLMKRTIILNVKLRP